MSIPLPSPRNHRSNSISTVPFRVVLPELDQVVETDRQTAGSFGNSASEHRLVLAETPEDESPLLPDSPIPVPEDENAPRGLVILEQVLGKRDSTGRPVTFARRLRHRLFGFALGLTIVSAAALVVGLVGDIDHRGLELPEGLENLGTSSLPIPEDLDASPLMEGAGRNSTSRDSTIQASHRSAEIQAAEAEALESNERPSIWFEGGIIEDNDSEPHVDGSGS